MTPLTASHRNRLRLVFLVAGAPALTYQVVWQRVLGLHLGVDMLATSLTVAAFMLGLGVGAMAGGWLADRWRRPVLLYALIELSLALLGASSLALLAWVSGSVAAENVHLSASALFTVALIPTTLMGMTLPLMCRILIREEGHAGSGFADIYALNTLGAAAGALVTGYLLIGLLGLDGATWAAAAVNLLLAVALVLMSRSASAVAPAFPANSEAPEPRPITGLASSPLGLSQAALVLVLAALSGFTALGYQLVWYRLLNSLLHGTVYVFSSVLAVFLACLALGAWMARYASSTGDPLRRFGLAQLLLAIYVLGFAVLLAYGSGLPGLRHAIGASSLTTFHPAPELIAGLVTLQSIYSLLDIALWTAAFIAVPCVLMGYGFPHLVSAASPSLKRLGRGVAILYLANILGSVAGALITGLVLLHYLGSERSLCLLVMLSLLTALAASLLAYRCQTERAPLFTLLTAATLALLLTTLIFPGPGALLQAVHYVVPGKVEFSLREDRSGVVALRTQTEIISFTAEEVVLGPQRLLINGSANGSFRASDDDWVLDSAVTIALAAHPAPRRVLVIGLGDGKMAAAAVRHPGVEAVTVVELSSVLPDLLLETRQGRALLQSDKLTLNLADGRRWLLEHADRRFDAILMWPMHAALAHSGSLYSLEFFELLRSRLTPGGLLYARTVDSYSTARTLATVFGDLIRIDEVSYVASDQALRFSARASGMPADDLLQRLQADRALILEATRGAALNRDYRPNSEYYLTYPYVSVLQTWGARPATYRHDEPEQLRTRIMP